MISKRTLVDKSGKALNIILCSNDFVSVKQMGVVTEVKHMTHRSNGGTTRKISKDEYVDERSGEVKQFQHHEKRTDDIKSIYETIAKGRDLIRANCIEPAKCLFITLTYADNMTDTKKLYNDFKNFMKRVPSEIAPHKWISCAEPQERGAWHLHAIFIYNDKAPFIENYVIRNAWKQGFVKIQGVDCVDDMGAYLCAYLTDLEISIDTPINDKRIKNIIGFDGLPKRIKKGARLYMYPAGMHIFRHSKNCIIPEAKLMTSKEADKFVYGQTLVYEKTTEIEDTDTNFSNIINTRVYNSIRKAKNDNSIVF